MIKVIESKKIIPFNERIKSVQIINGGTAVEVITIDRICNIPDFSKGTTESIESYFPVVKASELSLEDEFLQHKPETREQEVFKERLIQVIKSGISDFRAQKIDPSFDAEGNITYKYGNPVATNKSAKWWYDKAKEFMPEKNSRLGTPDERIAFLGIILKELISEEKFTVSKAWSAICDQNSILQDYMNCLDTEHGFATTGNGQIGEWCDLGTICKITVKQEEKLEFYLIGGNYLNKENLYPLADVSAVSCDKKLYFCSGWIVFSV